MPHLPSANKRFPEIQQRTQAESALERKFNLAVFHHVLLMTFTCETTLHFWRIVNQHLCPQGIWKPADFAAVARSP